MEERAIGEAVDVGVYRHQLTVYRETQPGGGTELEHALSFLAAVLGTTALSYALRVRLCLAVVQAMARRS